MKEINEYIKELKETIEESRTFEDEWDEGWLAGLECAYEMLEIKKGDLE